MDENCYFKTPKTIFSERKACVIDFLNIKLHIVYFFVHIGNAIKILYV